MADLTREDLVVELSALEGRLLERLGDEIGHVRTDLGRVQADLIRLRADTTDNFVQVTKALEAIQQRLTRDQADAL